MEKPWLIEVRVRLPARVLQRRWLVPLMVLLMLALAGCTAGKQWRYLPATRAEERSVYVVGHGWHTGIVLSSEELGNQLGFVKEYLREGRYYEFSWGEADWFQAEKVTPAIFLKTVFWRNPSVMLVVSMPVKPEKYSPGTDVAELTLSAEGLEHLKDDLRASFKLDVGNHPYPLKKGLHGESSFFAANGYYIILDTCNTWTAKVLASGGVPMDTVFTLRAASVMRQVKAAQKKYAEQRLLKEPAPVSPRSSEGLDPVSSPPHR